MPKTADGSVAGVAPRRFLFIASDFKPWPGGIGEYLDWLLRGLMILGDTAKLLAVVRPDEAERIAFLQQYEPWVVPFLLTEDAKPKNVVGRKCVSLLEILGCASPLSRRALTSAGFFRASAASSRSLEGILAAERPTMIVFGHLDVRLYALALCLQGRAQPYGILAHGSEIARIANGKRNDLTKRGSMVRGASWIVANSRHTERLAETWDLPRDRIKVIHPPISADALSEAAGSEGRWVHQPVLRLLTICRLVRGKGVDIVLHALKILVARGIPCRYVIGGDGPELGTLMTLARKLGLEKDVGFEGLVMGKQKWDLLRSSDVFVMPSRAESPIEQEGFGIAFIEAAAFGLPAVGSRTGGIPDAVIDGETGLLVPPESPAELADALTSLYRHPERRKQMGEAAARRATKEFSPTAVALRFRRETTPVARTAMSDQGT